MAIIRDLIIGVTLSTFSLCVFAETELSVKWTKEVGQAIKILGAQKSSGGPNMRIVEITYQALIPCRKTLSILGQNYSRDGARLGAIALTEYDFSAGQKFKHKTVVDYEAGHYLMFEKAYCR